MNRKEFYNIVKTEGLNKYNIGDSFEIPKATNVVGCINNNGWVVYETDERGAYHVISKHSSERLNGHLGILLILFWLTICFMNVI